MNDDVREKQIQQELTAIASRLRLISEQEARAVWTNGEGARGEFEPERTALTVETDRLLSELEKIGRHKGPQKP